MYTAEKAVSVTWRLDHNKPSRAAEGGTDFLGHLADALCIRPGLFKWGDGNRGSVGELNQADGARGRLNPHAREPQRRRGAFAKLAAIGDREPAEMGVTAFGGNARHRCAGWCSEQPETSLPETLSTQKFQRGAFDEMSEMLFQRPPGNPTRSR
jgi:hypothetical protein